MNQQFPIYQIDAFSQQTFKGNPAAVVPFTDDQADFLTTNLMQKIALENNLSETAFIKLNKDNSYELRWFTPTVEVPLCGHATLASAFVIFEFLQPTLQTVTFQTASGELTVTKIEDYLTLNFPVSVLSDAQNIYQPTNATIVDSVVGGESDAAKLLICLENEAAVRSFIPDLIAIKALPYQGLIVTAQGDEQNIDFVSRFFAPNAGIDEDPVTGSAHCVLTPYWASKLDKQDLSAQQISARGGDLQCRLLGNRVELSGQASCFLRGTIYVPA